MSFISTNEMANANGNTRNRTMLLRRAPYPINTLQKMAIAASMPHPAIGSRFHQAA